MARERRSAFARRFRNWQCARRVPCRRGNRAAWVRLSSPAAPVGWCRNPGPCGWRAEVKHRGISAAKGSPDRAQEGNPEDQFRSPSTGSPSGSEDHVRRKILISEPSPYSSHEPSVGSPARKRPVWIIRSADSWSTDPVVNGANQGYVVGNRTGVGHSSDNSMPHCPRGRNSQGAPSTLPPACRNALPGRPRDRAVRCSGSGPACSRRVHLAGGPMLKEADHGPGLPDARGAEPRIGSEGATLGEKMRQCRVHRGCRRSSPGRSGGTRR